MHIQTLKELKDVLRKEKQLYFPREQSIKKIERFKRWFCRGKSIRIYTLQKWLRICEYFEATANNRAKHLLLLYAHRRFFKLCEEMNIEIYPGNFGQGLVIYHSGIVVNRQARIGENCTLHGNNCIGNRGACSGSLVPVLGGCVDIGFGAVIIGDVHISDGIVIGANAVVNKSFSENVSMVAGVPAKAIKLKNEAGAIQ